MPETLERITLCSSDTPKYTSEPHIAAHKSASNASASVSENVDSRRIFLAMCSIPPPIRFGVLR